MSVVDFGGVTRLPTDPARVLERAANAGLQSVVIVGFDADCNEIVASSDTDGGDVLWHLERANLKLLRMPDELS